MSPQSWMRDKIPTVGRRAIPAQSLHSLIFILTTFIRAFFINVHEGVRPTWMQDQRSRHIMGCRCFLKVDYSTAIPHFQLHFTHAHAHVELCASGSLMCRHVTLITTPKRLAAVGGYNNPFKHALAYVSLAGPGVFSGHTLAERAHENDS